jgi:hypothetical protein
MVKWVMVRFGGVTGFYISLIWLPDRLVGHTASQPTDIYPLQIDQRKLLKVKGMRKSEARSGGTVPK